MAKSLWLLICALAFPWTIQAQTAGSIDSSFKAGSGPSGGSVAALVPLPDNHLLVGGSFSSWNGEASKYLVRLLTNGSLDSSFQTPALSGRVTGIYTQQDGKILVAGSFTNVAGQPRTNFVRLAADGALDPDFVANVDVGVTDAVELAEGRLLIVGSFKNVNGISRPGVAILLPNGTVDSTFNPDPTVTGNARSATVLSDGRILVPGISFNDNGRTIFGMVRFFPNGEVDRSLDLGSVSFFANEAYLLPHDNLLMDSTFNLARALANDSLDQHFTNGTSSPFAEILEVQPDERSLVGGSNVKDATGATSRLVRLFADGKIDPSFQTSLTSAPTAVALRPDGKIIVASFNDLVALHSNDASATSEVQWHATELDAVHNGFATLKIIRQGSLSGPATADWSAVANGLQITPTNGTALFGPGESVADVEVELASANDANGSVQLTLTNRLNAILGSNATLTLFVTNQTGVVEGPTGNFSLSELQGAFVTSASRSGPLNGTAAIGWRISGESDASQDFTVTNGIAYFGATDADSSITLRLVDNPLYQTNRAYKMEFFQVDPDWPLAAASSVNLVIADNDLPNYPGIGADATVSLGAVAADGGAFLYGVFQSMNGQTNPVFARVDATGRLVGSFRNPAFFSSLTDIIELPDRRILLSGSFTNVNGQTTAQVVRLLPNGELDPTFVQSGLRTSAPIAVNVDGSIVVAGTSTNFNVSPSGANLGAIVRLQPNGAKDENFSTITMAASPHHIATLPNGQFYAYGAVYANTNLNQINLTNAPFRSGVVRFNADGSIDPNFAATFGASNRLAAPARLYAYPDGRIIVGGSISNAVVNGRTIPDLARLSATGQLDLEFLTNSIAALTNSSSGFGRGYRIMDFDVSPQGKTLVFKLGSGGEPSSLVLLGPTGRAEANFRLTFPNNYLVAGSVRAYPDGRFLVTGPFIQVEGQNRFRFAWINADGTLAPQANLVVNEFNRVGEQNTLTITALAAGQFKIQRSINLIHWTDVTPVTLTAGEQTIQFQDSELNAFYRVTK